MKVVLWGDEGDDVCRRKGEVVKRGGDGVGPRLKVVGVNVGQGCNGF